MNKKNYIFKSDLIKLIQKQTGINRRQALFEANRIILKEESLGDKIFNFAGSSIYSGLIQNFTEQILDHLGIPSKSILGRIIANFIENLRYDQIQRFLSSWDEGGCEAWMKSLVDTVSETLMETLIDKILDKIDVNNITKDLGVPDEGPLSNLFGDINIQEYIPAIKSIIREKIFDVIFTPETREQTVAFLCDKLSELDFNMSSLSGLNPFSSKDEEK